MAPKLEYSEFYNVSINDFNIKNSHREKAPSNKTQPLTKTMNMDIWVVGTVNQFFIRDSNIETKFSKKQSSYWQNSVLCDRSLSYSPFYLS